MKKRGKEESIEKKGWKFFGIFKTVISIIGGIISTLITLLFIFFFVSLFVPSDALSIPSGNIAVIPVSGVIVESDSKSAFSQEVITSAKLIEIIKKVNESNKIKGIIFEINSPGGSPVASDEIASVIKEINKPKIAVIKEVGASGAYWIATAADKIFANKMSITGSIGVTSAGLEYYGLLARYNVTYRRLVSGELKDAGTPFREMTEKEKMLFQKLLDKIHEYFIEKVAINRKLPIEKVRELATGFVYLGEDAKELGLIDEIGSRNDAVKLLEKQLGITAEIAEFKPKKGLFDMFSSKFDSFFYFAGKGFGNSLVESKVQNPFEVMT